MIVSMMDDNTYVVGDKIYKVGDEVNLTDISVQIPGGPVMPAKSVNDNLLALAVKIRQLRSTICTMLHNREEHFSVDLADAAMQYENAQRDWLFTMDLLFKAIQDHLNAPVPLHRDTKTGKITIRKRDPREAMNYTREAVSSLVRFNTYAPLRDLIVKTMKVENTTIESDLHLDTEMPCMSTRPNIIYGAFSTCQGTAELLGSMISKGIASMNFGMPIILVWFVQGEPARFFDARGAVPRGQPQGNELIAIHSGITRAAKVLSKPWMIGVIVPTKVDKDKPGILVQAMSASDSYYIEYKLVEPDGLEMGAHGAGSRLHQNIETLINNTVTMAHLS